VSVIVHLIRHGQSTANRSKLIAGWTDAELTSRGIEQATALRGHISPKVYSSAWSSDLVRASETARLAGLIAHPDPRLRELNFGDLEAVPWESVAEAYGPELADFDSFVPPGGEPVVALRARVFSFLDELQPGTHAVVCHGGVIRVVLSSMGAHRFVSNCTVVKIDWTARAILSEEPLPQETT
jgi:broad specificity phosphatase PhoE